MVPLDVPGHDREAETDPPALSRAAIGVTAAKPLEDAVPVLDPSAGACVIDPDNGLFAVEGVAREGLSC